MNVFVYDRPQHVRPHARQTATRKATIRQTATRKATARQTATRKALNKDNPWCRKFPEEAATVAKIFQVPVNS